MDKISLSILKKMPDSIVLVFDTELNIVFRGGGLLETNNEESFGKLKSIETIKEYSDIFAGEVCDKYKEVLSGKTCSSELAYKGLYFKTEVFSVRENGKDFGVILMLEITEKRNTEYQLKESRKNVNALLDSIPEAAIMINREGKIITGNKSLAERVGKDVKDIAGMNIYELLPKKVAEYRMKMISTVFDTGAPLHFEDERNGHRIESFVYPVFGDNGEVERVSVIGVDRTRRRNVEDELELKAHLLDSTSDTVLLHDLSGNILYFNEAACADRGYTREEFTSLKIKDITDIENGIHYNRRMRDLLVKGNIIFESRHITKGGEPIDVEVHATLLETGESKQILSIIRDITAQKEQEMKIEEYISRLENDKKIIEENATELSKLNRRFAETEKKLRALNRDKDKFFSIIAHDLKSPFSAILGYSEILIEDYDDLEDEERKLFLKNLDSVSRSVYQLLENLLEWSRIQTGRINFDPQKIGPREVAEDVVELFSESARKKGIDLKNEIDTAHTVYADKNMTYTILRNLVSNAIKFTPGGGMVTLRSIKNCKQVILSVEDTGKGIDTDQLNKLFKLDNNFTTEGTNNETGSGLGLLLCKELAQKNRGDIHVESHPESGSKFFINLPMDK